MRDRREEGDSLVTKVVEGILTIVDGLGSRQRREFFRALLRSGLLTEDEQDVLVIESRRGGSTRPLRDFVDQMKRAGRVR